MESENVQLGGDRHGPIITYSPDIEDKPSKTAILDRDGVLNAIYIEETGLEDPVLNEERGPQNLTEFKNAEFDYTREALQYLTSDYQVAVLTNQPDVEKHERELSEESLREMNDYLIDLGADIVVACPHRPDNHEEEYEDVRLDGFNDIDPIAPKTVDREYGCNCHKPDESMYRFLEEFADVEFESSFAVGDKASDSEAALNHSSDITTVFLEHYPNRQRPEYADLAFDNLQVMLDNFEHLENALDKKALS